MVAEETWEATCEVCGEGQNLSPQETEERVGASGEFVCDECSKRRRDRDRHRIRVPRLKYRSHRISGCIVTYRLPDGEIRSEHREGRVAEALRILVAPLPEGTHVLCISTWRSIARDLKGTPRRYGAGKEVDPYGVERNLLGKIDRLDLLPPEADPLWSHHGAPSRRRGYRP